MPAVKMRQSRRHVYRDVDKVAGFIGAKKPARQAGQAMSVVLLPLRMAAGTGR